ncbi:MAG: phage head morphogenesis protein, partial [Clostridia bacterium]|nr:phage head morphogenesis protein [Clostridia bacterium]
CVEEIIKALGGGDKTKGSCASLAFAYTGNISGYNVLDFRGGESLNIICKNGNIKEITKLKGVKSWIAEEVNDFKAANNLLKEVEYNKPYIFVIGKHTAIIRRTKEGFEYLELQSPVSNGFKKLTNKTLKERFGAKKTNTLYGEKIPSRTILIDAETLGKNSEFKKILGYINTNKEKQIKGAGGHIK